MIFVGVNSKDMFEKTTPISLVDDPQGGHDRTNVLPNLSSFCRLGAAKSVGRFNISWALTLIQSCFKENVAGYQTMVHRWFNLY